LQHSQATPLFASKPTFARIDFLRQGERLVNKKGTHSVKFVVEIRQNSLCRKLVRVSNGTENMYACDG